MKKLKKFAKWYLGLSVICAMAVVLYSIVVPPTETTVSQTEEIVESSAEIPTQQVVSETTIAEASTSPTIQETTAVVVTEAETIKETTPTEPETTQSILLRETSSYYSEEEFVEEIDGPPEGYDPNGEEAYKLSCYEVEREYIIEDPEFYIGKPATFDAKIRTSYEITFMSNADQFAISDEATHYYNMDSPDSLSAAGWEVYSNITSIYPQQTVRVYGEIKGISNMGDIVIEARYMDR